jgi:hypothetical protein
MFDSQKLPFNNFIKGYKHGIYVFTDDACHVCQDYKESIAYINNAYLYFVEINIESEREQLSKLLDRSIFPLTACFKDNKLKYVRPGQLFDKQLEEIFADLKIFGDNPLSQDEIERRLEKERTKCILSYYIFSPTISVEDKQKVMEKAIQYNELPIDVDLLIPSLNDEQRLHLLEGQMPEAKLIIIKDGKTNIFSNFSQKIAINYTAINGNDAKFEIRNLDTILGNTNA